MPPSDPPSVADQRPGLLSPGPVPLWVVAVVALLAAAFRTNLFLGSPGVVQGRDVALFGGVVLVCVVSYVVVIAARAWPARRRLDGPLRTAQELARLDPERYLVLHDRRLGPQGILLPHLVTGPCGVVLVRDATVQQPSEGAWRCASDATELAERLALGHVRGLVVNGEPIPGHPDLLTCPRAQLVRTIEALPAVWDQLATVAAAKRVTVSCPSRR